MARKETMKIDITVDTAETKIIAHFDEYNSYAVVMSKYGDQVVKKVSIEKLVNVLEGIRDGKISTDNKKGNNHDSKE